MYYAISDSFYQIEEYNCYSNIYFRFKHW